MVTANDNIKKIKEWIGTCREVGKFPPSEFFEIIEIYKYNNGYFDVVSYQMCNGNKHFHSLYSYNGIKNNLKSLPDAKKAALKGTGYKNDDFEWIVNNIN